MKRLFCLAASFILFVGLHAQKNKNKDNKIPSFGDISKSELEIKDCEFDKNADALVLFEDGELTYLEGTGLVLEKHVRIKILKKDGLEQADIHLPYYSYDHDASIKDISAQTYNLDPAGTIITSKIDKKNIFDKKINKRQSEKIFTFPEVRVGSVIEYKYKMTGAGLIDWYFQHENPVAISRFAVDFPNDIEARSTPHCSHPLSHTTESSGTRKANIYMMENIPGLRDEGYVINQDDYMDRLETTISGWREANGLWKNRNANWVEVIKYLMQDEDFGVQLKRNIPRTADLDVLLKGVTDEYTKMKIIHKYVRDNMQWNEYYGIWALDGVKSAWKDKKGTTGEINLILVNLLKDAGLKAKPVLVSTHKHGQVNTVDAGTYDFPGFYQFNNVLAFVEIGDKFYVLDASEKNTPSYLIPYDVLMTEGLVIEKIDTYEWGWRTLWDPRETYKNTIVLNGEIKEDGSMNGQASIYSYDYARLNRMPYVKKGEKDFKERFLSSNSNITIDSIHFTNMEDDSLALGQSFGFTEKLNTAGDYTYFSANLFSGLEQNPFVADTRYSDVFFGSRQSYQINGSFAIPEGYQFEELPKNLRMIMPDTSISMTRISQISGNRVMLKITLDFNKPMFSVGEYDMFHEFYKKLFDILNEQYVIKKKVTP